MSRVDRKNLRKATSVQSSLRFLTNELAEGDEGAFENLHRRLDQGIQRFFARRGVGQEVEQLSQDVWIEAWVAVQEGRYQSERGSLDTFVFGVARTVLRTHRRAKHRDAGKVRWLLGTAASKLEDSRPNAGEVVDRMRSLEALRSCIRTRLSEGERTLLEGLFLDGLSERALARDLGLPRSTINERKAKYLRRLRECLRRRTVTRDRSDL